MFFRSPGCYKRKSFAIVSVCQSKLLLVHRPLVKFGDIFFILIGTNTSNVVLIGHACVEVHTRCPKGDN